VPEELLKKLPEKLPEELRKLGHPWDEAEEVPILRV
jgi:hypothetical protein